MNALALMLEQVTRECPDVPVAVFEDCGQLDDTEAFLIQNAKFLRRDMVLEADVYDRDGITIFLAHSNVGVCGNSNKAMKWFMDQTDCDHLCLCNDDLEVLGPFHQTYAAAHEKLEVGLFCFCDFQSEAYKWATVKARGLKVKLLTRMTGIMMSMTRALIQDIGYYDADNFTFGQEHCDYTNRARLRGHLNLNGQMQQCLDVECAFLKHQEVASSLSDQEKRSYNAQADVMIEEVAKTYAIADLYRPFSTGRWSGLVGGRDGGGIQLCDLGHYRRVKDSQLDGAAPISYVPPPETLPDTAGRSADPAPVSAEG